MRWLALGVGLCLCARGSTGDDSGTNDGGGGDSTTNGDSPFGGGDTGSSDSKPSGDACYAPVDMYIMMDRSCSMGTDCNIGDTTTNSKWCHAVNALSGYFNSSSASGNAAALQFFPVTNHQDTMCTTGATYDTPALPTQTPFYSTLPTNGFDSLLNATTDTSPCVTPTEGAVRGITKFTAANRRGGRVTVGMLITDGDPAGCDENLTDLSNILQAHFTATTLRTYVIGMTGADDANLEQIAQGGNAPMHPATVGPLTNACGTSKAPCRHWNVGSGNPQAFIAALAAIQQSSDGCADGGGTINPN
jgi:hypothetical protein